MENFYFLTHDRHDPYFNLASEEYLLTCRSENFIYVWVNEPAVILGVNQNAPEEVNFAYTEANNIKVARRRTGGGAVYHDEGNICYTVIAPFDSAVNNYKKFTAPVIEYLNTLGVDARFSGRNDITVEERKISGNAQTVYKDRIMHHGTLLFNTDLSVLSRALKPNPLKMQSKGIKSVRARVANISEFIKEKMTARQFKKGLCEYFERLYPRFELGEKDLARINEIRKKKYSSYEWIFGQSPKGSNSFEARFSFGTLKLNFDTENGVIVSPRITGDFFTLKDIAGLEKALEGARFTPEDVRTAISCISEYIPGADAYEFINKMFGEDGGAKE